MEELAVENFKFDKYGRKFSKRVQNTVGKGEIVPYEKFLLFPQCFQKTCKNQGLFGKGLNEQNVLTHVGLHADLGRYIFQIHFHETELILNVIPVFRKKQQQYFAQKILQMN